MRRLWIGNGILACGIILAGSVFAQAPSGPKPATPAKGSEKNAGGAGAKNGDKGPNEVDELALRQSRVADKYARLEELLGRMATFEAATNPRRAALLKQALTQSKDRLTMTQLNKIVAMLNQNTLDKALDGQGTVDKDLKALLELLQSENRADRLKSEQARIREYIKEVERLLRLERGIQGQTEGGADAKQLSEDQQKIADRTQDLAKKIQENEEGGEKKSSDSKDDKDGKNKDGKNKDDKNKPSDQNGDKKDADLKDQDSKDKKNKPDANPSDSKDPAKSSDSKSGDKQGDKKDSDKKDGDKKEGSKTDDGKEKDKKDKDKKDGDKKAANPKDDKKDPKDSSKPSDPQDSDSKESKPQDSKSKDSPPQPPQQSPPPSGEDQKDQQDQKQPDKQQDNPARKRIQAAEERMREAERKLAEAKRKEAIEEQEKAKAELEKAKAALEEILREMREEEIERTLAQLEGRFKKMLEMQIKVYESTKRLDKIPTKSRGDEVTILSGRLASDERRIAFEADKALNLLREEGSSIALPETVEQMREDMEHVASRLDRTEVGTITQNVEEDIISALEEVIAALQKAQKDQDDKKQKQQQQQQQGPPQDQPLVDKIAELKMIRSLQLRVNGRTKRYARLLDNEEDVTGNASDADLRQALGKLGEREESIQRITRDIVLGKNK